MISGIRKFFRDEIVADAAATDPEARLRLATCALLLEIAQSDDDFADEERNAVIAAVRTRFGLDAEAAERLLALADEERSASSDLYQFTRLIKEHFARPEMLRIVGSLWDVVWSDGVLEAHEDAMMHKIGTLLGLDHRELMALKTRARRDAED